MVAVFLVLLVVGFLELILVLHTYNVLADSAKEGVRYAIVHGSANIPAPSGPAARVRRLLGSGWYWSG